MQPEGKPERELLTERQAAGVLPMSLAWFRRRRLVGGGPAFVRIGARIFYSRRAIEEFIRTREVRV